METLLVGLLVLGIATVTVCGAGLLLLARRNRLVPGVRTSAPMSWLWRQGRPPRYHRRLRRALRGATAAVAQGSAVGLAVDGLADCVAELRRQAIAVDEQLVAAARFGGPVRRAMLQGLRPKVIEIERLAARLAAAVVARTTLTPDRLDAVVTTLHDRLDALDAAHAEIAQLETAWRNPPVPIARTADSA